MGKGISKTNLSEGYTETLDEPNAAKEFEYAFENFEHTPYGSMLLASMQASQEQVLTPYLATYFDALSAPPTQFAQEPIVEPIQDVSTTPFKPISPYMQMYIQAQNAAVACSPYLDVFNKCSYVATPHTSKIEVAEQAVADTAYFIEDIQDSKIRFESKKATSIIFLIAFLSALSIALVLLTNIFPLLSIGVDIFNIYAIAEIGYHIYGLVIFYTLFMQLCFALSLLTLFSNEQPFFGWFALSALVFAIVFTIIRLDIFFDFNLARILSSYGLLIMIALPLLILILRPFCIVKRKIS